MTNLTGRQYEIMQSSIRLISEGGIQHFTIKALAESLGISEPAIYRHFSSKMDILLSMLTFTENEGKDFRETVNSESPSLHQIEIMFSRQAKLFTENPALSAIIFSEEIFQNDTRLSEKVLQLMNERQDIIYATLVRIQQVKEIRTDIDPEYLTLMIMGTLRLIISKWRLNKFSFDLEQEISRAWAALHNLLT